ncbi:carboxylate-amine ligase [Nocardioides sp. LHG3406-4]|uniref:carboxylate-amine ligase n=1 Tax=Nocardioides sp. LHG3406-4 TaxID=2804575 RepID=UPI003CE8CABD
MVNVRQVGVEEELLLVDSLGAPSPSSEQVLALCAADTDDLVDVTLVREFFQAQVEIVTAPAVRLEDIGTRLRSARAALARASATIGVAPVAVAGPVVDAPNGPLVHQDRFEQIGGTYGRVAADSLMCAVQVHVEVEDRAEGVGVIDRVRPWVPLLLAISANSPFWHGQDTGFASWRSQVWRQWPSSGPTELFGDVTTYDALTVRMLETGAILDVGLLNLDVRLSARYPTVEFRVADACTSVEDALTVAALSRALTETAAREHRRGVPPVPWRVDQLRVGAWRAARFGLTDTLLHPLEGGPVPAAAALAALLHHVAPALEDAGDLTFVTDALGRLGTAGTGADRQRRALDEHGDLASVVGRLRRWTVAPAG